jgi:hypothetical protein
VPRRVKLSTREMGEVTLLLIDRAADGTWEAEWESLRNTVFGAQFSVISRDVLNHALNGWSKPLSEALGISPEGAILKIPLISRECFLRRNCPMYEPRDCSPRALNMPRCFEPGGVTAEIARATASQAIDEWRNHVHLVVIQ